MKKTKLLSEQSNSSFNKYSQSNGVTEVTVKIAKYVIKKCKDNINLGLG